MEVNLFVIGTKLTHCTASSSFKDTYLIIKAHVV